MTQTRDFRKGATRRSPRNRGSSGWLRVVLGVLLGLGVAAVYVHVKQKPAAEAVAHPKQHQPMSEADIPEGPVSPIGSYTYPDRLQHGTVTVPEKAAPEPKHETRAVPETRPGTYMLQIASYKSPADADKEHGRLAMVGVESKIQAVQVNGDTYYRVRVGPYKSLDEYNAIRARLRNADIEATPVRLN